MRMRKRFRVLIVAAIAAAVVVRVGFALSLQSGPLHAPGVPPSAAMMVSTVSTVSTSASAPVLLGGSVYTRVPRSPQVPDGATLLVLGTLLIGLAAAVRRAA
jgi:hypothetical protein